jgi:hypothetical protein
MTSPTHQTMQAQPNPQSRNNGDPSDMDILRHFPLLAEFMLTHGNAPRRVLVCHGLSIGACRVEIGFFESHSIDFAFAWSSRSRHP